MDMGKKEFVQNFVISRAAADIGGIENMAIQRCVQTALEAYEAIEDKTSEVLYREINITPPHN